jgi:thiol-disulfide isomerase/thioredoxin
MPPATTARDMNLAESRWTLLDGRRAGLADFRGQVVVLDFYATYCPPCRDEIPHLNALQRRFKNDGVNIIGLNVGGEADRLEVPKFVKELGIAYPLGNPDEPLVQTLFSDNDAIPQTYVFDRRGRLVQRFVGYDTTMPAELETAIQTALATTAD